MKISLLTPDLSRNCAGRAYLLAKILQEQYEVEIIGPLIDGRAIWEPIAHDDHILYKPIAFGRGLRPYCQVRELLDAIAGEVVYASKPFLMSFGIGLLAKAVRSRALVLDIDDWEMGAFRSKYRQIPLLHRPVSLFSALLWFYKDSSIFNHLLCRNLVGQADQVTVSNTFLRHIFGGTIIYHARDTEAFNPDKYDRAICRKRFGVETEADVVMFLGTPRPHKGVELLVEAINLLDTPNVLLIVAGIDHTRPYDKSLAKYGKDKLGKRFLDFGSQRFSDIPQLLSIADVVVIPQKATMSSVGQLPAKVFDAMAMAKPIVATPINDLPEILDGCGWIAKSDEPEDIAEGIRWFIINRESAEAIGEEARQRCVDLYSFDAMRIRLLDIFRIYE